MIHSLETFIAAMEECVTTRYLPEDVQQIIHDTARQRIRADHSQQEPKILHVFGFQLGMPSTDHASERLSRKAKRLDNCEEHRFISAELQTPVGH